MDRPCHSFIEEESKGYVSKARISFERLGRSPGMFGEDEDEDLLVLIWKRGRFSNETEQEEYFRKFSMIWPRVKGKRVASLKKFNGAKFRL